MQAASFPENEAERLEALKKYQILDTDFEKEYNDMVRLTSQICETPIALISLIGAERQWFKARVGLDVSETHRDLAFCSHAIYHNDLFIIPDASQDERFADNPLVTGEPSIRFYAGKPLTTPDGFNLGTLCVIDTKPRILTETQKFALKTLGNQVIVQMELKIKLRQLETNNLIILEQNEELQSTKEELNQNLEELQTVQKNLAVTFAHNQAITAALDNSTIVSIADLKGNIIKVNSIFCKISGYSEAELLGQNHRIVNSGYHPRSFWVEMWKTISKGNTWHAEVCNKTKNGEIYWVDTVINPVYDSEGKIYQYLSIRTLVTDRKKADALLQRTSLLLDDAQRLAKMGAWELDLQTGITYWTEGVYDIHEVERTFDHNKANGIEFYHPDYRPVISQAIQNSITEQKPFDVICKFITAKSQELWVRATGYPIVKDGQASSIIGMFQDITEQKNAEQAIAESQAKLQNVLNEVEDVIWSVRMPDYQTIFVSPSVEKIYGYSVEEWIKDSSIAQKAIYGEDKAQLAQIFASLETEGAFDAEYRIVSKTGEIKWIRNKAKIILDKNQQATSLDGIVTDISSRKQAEEKILSAKKQLQNFFELNTDFMTIANTQGYFEIINPTFERELGYTEEELTSQQFLDMVHPEDVENTLQEVAKLAQGALTIDFENRYRKKNGEYIWLSWRTAPDPQTGKLFATARNISLNKKADKLAQLNLVLKDRPHIKELGKSSYFDNVLKGLLDLTESEYGFLGEVFYENDQPYLKTYVLTNIAWNEETRAFYTKHAPTGLEFRNLDTLFGYALKHKTLVISNDPSHDSRRGGLPHGHPDLNAFLGIPIMDIQGLLIGMIGVANKKGGYTNQDATFLGAFLDSFANIIQTFQSERKRLVAELELQKQNEKLLSSEEELKQNLGKLASQRDQLNLTLDELKLSQNQMIRSEKLAVMGKLVASVAHELNTPLGAIQASAGNMLIGLQKSLLEIPKIFQILSADEQTLFFDLVRQALKNQSFFSSREERQARKKLEADLQGLGLKETQDLAYKLSSVGFYENLTTFMPLFQHSEAVMVVQIAAQLINQQKSIRTIQSAIEKASKVVFALKNYARHDQNNQKIKAKISDSLETVLTLYRVQMKHTVEIVRKYDDMPEISCYLDELNQVWTNLIHNALQAMDNKGKLEIRAKQEGTEIEVRIKDSGKGIPKAIRDRIFEPFFTTKPIGEGSGLGLDIVFRIIEKHKGQIWCESEEGVGTTFFVRLPIGE